MNKIDKKNLLKRVLTAFTAGGLAVFLITYHYLGFWIVSLLVYAFCLAEFAILSQKKLWSFYSIWMLVVGLSGIALGSGVGLDIWTFKVCIILLSMGLPVLLSYYLISGSLHSIQETGSWLLGLVWLTPAFIFWIQLAHIQGTYDFRVPLGMLLLNWCADTSAFFAGKFFGKHKIHATISPNKSYEGLAGGILGNLAFGYFLNNVWAVSFSWVLIGLLTVFVGLIGDLVESMFKRSLEIKDSSGLLPGHGGFLDRFDGFFFTIPFNWLVIVVGLGT